MNSTSDSEVGAGNANLMFNIRKRNLNNIIIGNLNVASLPGKIDELRLIVKNNIDILVLTETKLDDSFPTAQFAIDGFSMPYRQDRNRQGGGILIYVREYIPTKMLNKHTFPDVIFENENSLGPIEGIFIEINLRKTKWLLFGTYHRPIQNDEYYFENLSHALDVYVKDYNKFLLAGDFNCQEHEEVLKSFIYQYDANNLVKDNTCFKSVENPSCIDLFITNSYRSFQNTTVLNVGNSDFHKMVITVLKSKFPKSKPKEVYYRNYKFFDKDKFKLELKKKLQIENNSSGYYKFENIFLSTLENHAPMKKKVLRGNQVQYMSKALRKAIMKRTQLRSKYYKTNNIIDLNNLKIQRNYVSRLYKKEKKKFFNNIDMSNFSDNYKFWKNINRLFSEKVQVGSNITLVSENQIISEDKEVAETLNNFFKNAVSNLGIEENTGFTQSTEGITDPIDIAIHKFKEHPSIVKIKEVVGDTTLYNFNFSNIEQEEIEIEIKNLNQKKATTFKNIPPKILKQSADTCGPYLKDIVNGIFQSGSFPDELKKADVTAIFKSTDKTQEKNYRPVSVLPTVSKIIERIMQKQFGGYMEKYLSDYLCGYRKGYNAQHALLALLENWKSALDKNGYTGAVLMDLSKAFDCLNHELLLAKLHAYGCDKSSLKLFNSYLTNRWQRTKVNTSFSSWFELLLGIPQGSVLGPLLFNIYINDLFWLNESSNVCNFADDTTFYASDQNLDSLLNRLELVSLEAIDWFKANYMKLNEDKCHLLIGGNKYEHVSAMIGNSRIWESRREKLLGIHIENNLSFNYHITEICNKAGRKVSALARMSHYLSSYRRRLIAKTFIESQFSYCPLVWMFHDRAINRKINKLHERTLRIVYSDYTSTFEELLEKDNSFTIHQRNIQSLAIEMYKTKHGYNPNFMKNIFVDKRENGYSLRSKNKQDFESINIYKARTGEDTLRFLGCKIWEMVPVEIKEAKSLDKFKNIIKCWAPVKCPCRMCRNYIQRIGYVD